MLDQNLIRQIKEYAEKENVPIMSDDGIMYLIDYIGKYKIKRILEIGTAIGYSTIMMCSCADDITITSIERDENDYRLIVEGFEKNISKVFIGEFGQDTTGISLVYLRID